jgi:hypothetical protein
VREIWGPLIQFARWVGADVRELIWVSLFVREKVIQEVRWRGMMGMGRFFGEGEGRLVIFVAPGCCCVGVCLEGSGVD